jgi:PAS domain S-box-containing protein
MIDFKKYISGLCTRAEEMLRKGAVRIPGEKGGLSSALSARRSRHVAWIVMFAGLMISAAVTLYMKSSTDEIAEKDFIFHCREIQNTISGRLYDHARILRSGAAFFNASEMVTREKWHIYTKLQRIEQQLPGIQGIGFSLLIPRENLTRHIQEIRSEGFPEYTVKPDGDRESYSAIIYLEPFSDRNLRAFGYDMLLEPVRRAAMERARDTDYAVLSGKVVLIQETGKEVQAGTLMFVPVYRRGMPTDSVEQRRTAIYGWVYSPYRMNDLMKGILSNSNLDEIQLGLKIFDGEQLSQQNLLYETFHADNGRPRAGARFILKLPVDFNGHRWTLYFTQTGGGFFTAEYAKAWLTLVGGTFITLLLFLLSRALLKTRKEQRMAEELNVALRKERQRMTSIIQGSNLGTLEWDVQSGKTILNDIWAKTMGYSLHELAPVSIKTWKAMVHPDDVKLSEELQARHFSGDLPFYDCEFRMKHKDGHWVWIHEHGQLITRTGTGKPIMMFGTLEDISERKRLEVEKAKLEEQNRQLQKSDSLRRMSGAVAHNFNNQLQIVQGYLEMVIGDLPLDDSCAVKLAIAMQAAQKASEVSGNLLAYLGQRQVKLEPIDLTEVCRSSLPGIEAGKPENVILETDLPSPGPCIKADAKQIQQILTSLVVNAWEAIGEESGTVRLSVKTVPAKDIPESCRHPLGWQSQDQHYACLAVTDSGCGIGKKDMENLFDPFFSTKFTGRGLGLSIVLGIARTHGAGITVENRINGGSVFSMFFPLSKQIPLPA